MAADENEFIRGIKAGMPTKQKRCGTQNIQHAEYFSVRWHARIAPEIEPADLLVSDFWHGVHKQLRSGSIIEAWAPDRFFAELLIQDAGPSHVTMTFLRVVQLQPAHPAEADLPEGYTVGFAGPSTLWCVYRGDALLQAGFLNKSAARDWLRMPGRTAQA